MRRARSIVKRTLVSFYDDQMTHHAAALTYYALMSLFPAVLLALSLLGLLGQYPETYNAIIGYLREVAPASVVEPLDRSLRGALQSKGTAATALAISVVLALYRRPPPGWYSPRALVIYNQMVVETKSKTDDVFHALADSTRRDILRRAGMDASSVSRLADAYPMSFAAVQKHVVVLERAGLVTKRRRGREQLVEASPETLADARRALDDLEEVWRGRVERMSELLESD